MRTFATLTFIASAAAFSGSPSEPKCGEQQKLIDPPLAEGQTGSKGCPCIDPGTLFYTEKGEKAGAGVAGERVVEGYGVNCDRHDSATAPCSGDGVNDGAWFDEKTCEEADWCADGWCWVDPSCAHPEDEQFDITAVSSWTADENGKSPTFSYRTCEGCDFTGNTWVGTKKSGCIPVPESGCECDQVYPFCYGKDQMCYGSSNGVKTSDLTCYGTCTANYNTKKVDDCSCDVEHPFCWKKSGSGDGRCYVSSSSNTKSETCVGHLSAMYGCTKNFD